MPKFDVLKLSGVVAILAIVAFLGYGSYRWYFKRPPQTVVNNEYKQYTITGQNATVNEAPKATKQKQKEWGLLVNYAPQDKRWEWGVIKLLW